MLSGGGWGAQTCPTLCDPMDCSLKGSTVHGIFQARILEWIAMSYSRYMRRYPVNISSMNRWSHGFYDNKRKWSPQLCLTLCDPMDYSLPCSSVHGIFQARVLEWVEFSFSIYDNSHRFKPQSYSTLFAFYTFDTFKTSIFKISIIFSLNHFIRFTF